jgi:hypothetical protein
MKQIVTIIFLSFLFFVPPAFTQQDEAGSKLTVSIVKEPLTLQSNRIKGHINYLYNNYNQYFNENGEILSGSSLTMVSRLSKIAGFLEFGLSDNWQIGLYANYHSEVESYKQYSKDYLEESYIYNYAKEITGFNNVLVNLGYHLPVKTELFSLAFFPGLYLPASTVPKRTQSDIIPVDEIIWAQSPMYNVNIVSYEKVGSGTFRAELAVKSKLTINNNFSFLFTGCYNRPLGTYNSIYWKTIYDGSQYEFVKKDIVVSSSHELVTNIELQAVPDKKEIIGIVLGYNMKMYTSKWVKMEGNKTYEPYKQIISVYTGIELIVTEHIRFIQNFWYDAAGKNSKGAFGSESGFTFNFIKKIKHP